MENPNKIDDWGVPLFQETSILNPRRTQEISWRPLQAIVTHLGLAPRDPQVPRWRAGHMWNRQAPQLSESKKQVKNNDILTKRKSTWHNHIYTHTHLFKHINIIIYIYIVYRYRNICIYICIYIYLINYIHIYYIESYIYMWLLYMCVYVCLYVCLYLCMFVSMYACLYEMYVCL